MNVIVVGCFDVKKLGYFAGLWDLRTGGWFGRTSLRCRLCIVVGECGQVGRVG